MAHTKVTKNGTQNTGTANTFSYSGSFDVFKASEVEVELDNIALTFTTSTINESASPREYTVDYNAKTVHIGGANLTSNDTVVIQPVTDMGDPTPRATYAPGASITSDDLNNNQLQLMRKAMEYNEQKLSSRGGTMTGNLHLGQNVDLSFEGDNDNAYETTITVADPTSDKTITFPDTTGTVVTTGDTGTVATAMIAGDAITSAKIGDDQINSEHYVDGSIDTAHIGNAQVTADKLGNEAVTTAKIQNLAVTTAKINNGAITTAKIGAGQVTLDKLDDNSVNTNRIIDGNVTTAKLAADAVTNAKIADDSIDSEHYVDGSIDTAHIADAQITTAKIANDAITNVKIANGVVGTNKLADDAVTNAKIANLQVGTDKIAATSVTDAKLASNAVTTGKITDANVTTVKIADSNITLAKLASDLKQTSISNSDTQLPTSGAVVDYVAAQIAPLGGLEVIATEVAFPNSQPSSGVVISISDAQGVVVNGSGTSTTGRTVGGSTVTINNFPSSLNNETLAAGVGLMVSSTGSSQIYNYHKLLAAETDVKQLSDDINDFNARYRVGSSNPTSSLDGGDLFFNTGSGKLLVYNNTQSAWEEAQSIGQYFINTISSYSGTGGNSASFNNNAYRFVLSNPGTVAEQHIVSINGVIQKPNSGTSQPSEGFAIDGSSIIFSSAPATGSDFFIITIGSTVNIGTPSDGTVTASKIASGAVETAKIADGAVTEVKLGVSNSPTNGYFLSAQSGNTGGLTWAQVSTDLVSDTSPQLGGNLDTNDHHILLDDNHHVIFGDGEDLKISHDGTDDVIHSTGTSLRTRSNIFRANNEANNAVMFRATAGGNFEAYYDGSKKFETVSTGVSISGKLETTGFLSVAADNQHLKVGAGDDLKIFHDGTDSFVQNETGTFYIKSKSNEEAIKCVPDAQVELMYDGGGKYSTANLGGVLTGGSPYTELLVQTSGGVHQGKVQGWGSGNDREIGFAEPASQQWFVRYDKNASTGARNEYHWQTINPAANNTYDLGSSSYRWGNIFTNDLHLSNEGSSNDIDQTWGDWTIQEGESDLFLKNNRSGKKYKFNLTEVS